MAEDDIFSSLFGSGGSGLPDGTSGSGDGDQGALKELILNFLSQYPQSGLTQSSADPNDPKSMYSKEDQGKSKDSQALYSTTPFKASSWNPAPPGQEISGITNYLLGQRKS